VPQTKELTIIATPPTPEQALKVFARSTFRELTNNGYTPRQVVFFTCELIDLVRGALRAGPG
jgi:hypothetical protein